jgi:hypothetical protein
MKCSDVEDGRKFLRKEIAEESQANKKKFGFLGYFLFIGTGLKTIGLSQSLCNLYFALCFR